MNAIVSRFRPDLSRAITLVHQRMNGSTNDDGPLLVGVSGIHSSGKGYVAKLLENALCADGYCVATVNADKWHKLPADDRRTDDQGRTFYQDDAALDDLFNQILLPMKHRRTGLNESNEFRRSNLQTNRGPIDPSKVDIILAEGMFLFKSKYQEHIDLMVWVDCLPETALQRAVERRREGATAESICQLYRSIYFPSQILYFTSDQPRAASDVIVFNDSRMFARPATDCSN